MVCRLHLQDSWEGSVFVYYTYGSWPLVYTPWLSGRQRRLVVSGWAISALSVESCVCFRLPAPPALLVSLQASHGDAFASGQSEGRQSLGTEAILTPNQSSTPKNLTTKTKAKPYLRTAPPSPSFSPHQTRTPPASVHATASPSPLPTPVLKQQQQWKGFCRRHSTNTTPSGAGRGGSLS